VTKHRVFIVDGEHVFRRGLRDLLETEPGLMVAGEAASVADALATVQASMPDLILIEIAIEKHSGMDLIKSLRDMGVKCPILVLSTRQERKYAEPALRRGANGYIMKRESGERIVEVAREVIGGRTYVGSPVRATVKRRLIFISDESDAGYREVKDRELEVLELMGRGVSIEEIARKLFLSVKAIESRISRLRKKLNVMKTADLKAMAIEKTRVWDLRGERW